MYFSQLDNSSVVFLRLSQAYSLHEKLHTITAHTVHSCAGLLLRTWLYNRVCMLSLTTPCRLCRLRVHARSVSGRCVTQRQALAEGITNMSNNMSDRTDLNVRHRAQPCARHVVQPSATESGEQLEEV